MKPTKQQGDIPVEPYDVHGNEVRFICPKCCSVISTYKHAARHTVGCWDCGKFFDLKWQAQDVEIMMHAYAGIDLEVQE